MVVVVRKRSYDTASACCVFVICGNFLTTSSLAFSGKSLSSDEQHQVIGHLHEYLQLLKTDITDERTSIDERLKKELQVAREFTEASMKEIMTEKMEVQIDALKGDFEKEVNCLI